MQFLSSFSSFQKFYEVKMDPLGGFQKALRFGTKKKPTSVFGFPTDLNLKAQRYFFN
jgi:hypothetical protein